MTQEAAAQQQSPVAPRRGRGAAAGLPAAVRAWRRLPPRLLFRQVLFAAKHPLHATAVYRWSLRPNAPVELRCEPPDPWPGDPDAGQAILHNRPRFLGRSIAEPSPLWAPREADAAWLAELHGFAWLRDLRALGGDLARRAARQLVGDWITRHPGPGARGWAPAVVGRRLTHWLGQSTFFAASADDPFKARLFDSAARQATYLSRVLPADATGAELLAAVKGLIYAGVCLNVGDDWLRRGLALLESELPRQLNPDGGHASRSPSVHLAVLRDLIDLRATLVAGGHEPPRSLTLAIESMAPVLKMFQHGDGGLALFNDSQEADREALRITLRRAAVRARTQTAAPQSGFQRIQNGKTLVIADAGEPAAPGLDRHAHAGTLSFELSEGKHRIVVNCGAQPGHPLWRDIQRTTAAHSTLGLAETNASELLPGGGLGRRPDFVICRREVNDGAVLLDMAHDGYHRAYGTDHARRLYVSVDGEDIRGEDTLTGPDGLAFAVRFHLHPDVRASEVQDGNAVLLSTSAGGGWRFRASGAALALEDSVYLGQPGSVRRTRQIVLSGHTAPEQTVVKWALKREGAKR